MKTNTANASWISKRPDRCGGDACVREMRIPVWSLVEARRLGMSEADLLEAYPSLTPADLLAGARSLGEEPVASRSAWFGRRR